MKHLINSFSSFLKHMFSEEPNDLEDFSLKEERLGSSNVFFFLSYEKHKELLIALKRSDPYALAVVKRRLFEGFISLRSKEAPDECVLIIPIPQSKRRVLKRGFNPVRRLIFETLLFRDRTAVSPLFGILVKTRETRVQSRLSAHERALEQKGVFEVREKEKIQGKTVILFDDIVTTGATLNEARTVLLKSGARKVVLLALAH